MDAYACRSLVLGSQRPSSGPAAGLKPVDAALLARGGDVKPAPALYQNAVDIGAKKAAGTPRDTLLLGIISGCHIAFGGLLAVTIGANLPGIKVRDAAYLSLGGGTWGLVEIVAGGERVTVLVGLGSSAESIRRYQTVSVCCITM